MTLSLCMIVKNEEDVLARCLESVADLVDEIVIVDTGSTDRTVELARNFTERIFFFEWIDDFAAARNFSFEQATGDYCLWLDADDVLLEADRQALRLLKASLSPTVSVVMLPYHTGFDAQGNLTFSYYRERILRNHESLRFRGAVHEVVEPIGEILYGDCAITHRKLHPSEPERNLRIFEKQLEKGLALDPRQRFYYARELYYHKDYTKAIAVLEDFLSQGEGWLENQLDACAHLAYCHYALGEEEAALAALLRSLSLDLPRAELCCEIGKHFFERESFRLAAFWYSLATNCKRDDTRGGFTAPDCYDYLPCLQLCVCYSRLGDQARAARFNELAAQCKPDAEAVAHNRAYFESCRQAQSPKA